MIVCDEAFTEKKQCLIELQLRYREKIKCTVIRSFNSNYTDRKIKSTEKEEEIQKIVSKT